MNVRQIDLPSTAMYQQMKCIGYFDPILWHNRDLLICIQPKKKMDTFFKFKVVIEEHAQIECERKY